MRVLLTGGTGFIGFNLVRRLIEYPEVELTVVDNYYGGGKERIEAVRELHEKGALTLYGGVDFSDAIITTRVQKQEFDVILHQAALPRVSFSVEFPWLTNNGNVDKTLILMQAAIGNVKRFQFASSSSVYGGSTDLPISAMTPKSPKSPYALQKSIVEDYLKMFSSLYDMDTVSLRYFNVFGPFQYGDSPYSTAVSAWCHAMKNGLPMRSDGTGEQSRDLCYVDNVVDANILTMNSKNSFKGECFNVACGDRISNNQILAHFLARFPSAQVTHAPARMGDVMHTQADIQETRRVLGYEPVVRFWEGLERTMKWWEIA